ncbi:unnamed protein product [Sphacelaria rigidula]
MAGTPDGSDSATIAHMECGDAETRAGCGGPATDPSASSAPVPVRSAAAEVFQPPNKANFSREEFKMIIDESLRNLPVASRIAEAVMIKVRKRCKDDAQWLLPVAEAVMSLAATRLEIKRIWHKLIAALRAVMTGPANSTRASRFTKLRQDARHGEMLAFVTQFAVEAAASLHLHNSGGDHPSPEAERALVACYLFLERAS